MDDESSCYYVGSRGLLKSCDNQNPNPRSSLRYLDYDLQPHTLKNGDSIYICSAALSFFVNHLLPHIKTRFILVSGDSDDQIPIESLSSNDFDRLIADDRLIVWFSQNLIYSPKQYPKIQFLPIGLDYHSMVNCDSSWGPKSSPKTQEQLLFAVVKKARPFVERKPTAYTTFHFAIHRGSRQQAYDQIPKDLVYYEPRPVTRLESFNRQIEYAFVVSPQGEGIDCHRTWEALCLGCIPIMISTPIDDMFEGLPVLIVKEWSDVTRELLNKTIAEYSMKEWCMEKLQLKYWVDLINSYKKLV